VVFYSQRKLWFYRHEHIFLDSSTGISSTGLNVIRSRYVYITLEGSVDI